MAIGSSVRFRAHVGNLAVVSPSLDTPGWSATGRRHPGGPFENLQFLGPQGALGYSVLRDYPLFPKREAEMEQRGGPKDLARGRSLPWNRGGIERRQFPRVEVKFKVPLNFKGGQTEGAGTLIDLSLGGCAIKSLTRVEKGTIVDLSMRMSGTDEPLRIVGGVCWAKPGVFGVEFYKINTGKEEQTKLDLLLQELQSQTLSADEELSSRSQG